MIFPPVQDFLHFTVKEENTFEKKQNPQAHLRDREGGTFFYEVLIKKAAENGCGDVAVGQQNPC